MRQACLIRGDGLSPEGLFAKFENIRKFDCLRNIYESKTKSNSNKN